MTQEKEGKTGSRGREENRESSETNRRSIENCVRLMGDSEGRTQVSGSGQDRERDGSNSVGHGDGTGTRRERDLCTGKEDPHLRVGPMDHSLGRRTFPSRSGRDTCVFTVCMLDPEGVLCSQVVVIVDGVDRSRCLSVPGGLR